MKELQLTESREPEVRERADAARNRLKVLEAAARLFANRGVDNVSMEEVARAAGVGKGTLFRRFGDRATLARTVLDEDERGFQERLLRGSPPLGPGASARKRVRAFGEAQIDRLEEQGDLMLAGDGRTACARYRSPVYLAYRAHLFLLIREADPDADAAYVADLLLSALSPEFYRYQRQIQEMPIERIKAGWGDLVDRLLPT